MFADNSRSGINLTRRVHGFGVYGLASNALSASKRGGLSLFKVIGDYISIHIQICPSVHVNLKLIQKTIGEPLFLFMKWNNVISTVMMTSYFLSQQEFRWIRDNMYNQINEFTGILSKSFQVSTYPGFNLEG